MSIKIFDTKRDNDTLINAPRDITNFMFTQYTADRGIEKFGQLAVDALMKEFCQLEDIKVCKPVFFTQTNLLTKNQSTQIDKFSRRKEMWEDQMKICGRWEKNENVVREMWNSFPNSHKRSA